MRNFYIKPGMILRLGREGENLARRLIYDFSRWRDTFGDGIVQLIVQRPGEDTPYPVALKIEGETAVWEVTNADTAIPGSGKAEFQYFVGDTLEKSETFATNILDALGAAGAEAPEPAQDWMNKVLSAANRAESAAIHQPTIIDSTWWVWNPETGVYEDTGEVASAFTVTVTLDPDVGFVADKTNAEIYAAYTAGMSVHAIVPDQGLSLPLVSCTAEVAEFYGVTDGGTQYTTLHVFAEGVGIMGGIMGGGTVETDTTLTESGKPADAKAVGDALSNIGSGTDDYAKLNNKPKINGVELSGDKSSADLGIGEPTDEQVASAVEAYLDEHPEATTTVEDGSITEAKLADGAVAPEKTSFLEFSRNSANLFDKSTVMMNVHRYHASPWDIQTSTTQCLSDFIPVEAGKVYIRGTESFMLDGAKSWQYTYFADADKNFISSLRHYPSAGYNQSFTTPENCAYVQMSMPMTSIDSAMFCEGDTEPSEYVPYREYYKLSDSVTVGVDNIESLSAIFEAMPNGSITSEKLADEVTAEIDSVDSRVNTAVAWNDAHQPTKTLTGRINVFEKVVKGVFDIASDISDKTIIVHGVNYFDINDLIPGLINNTTGAIVASTTGYYTNNLIPVQPGKRMFWNRNNSGTKSYINMYFYGADGEFLRRSTASPGGRSNQGMFTLDDDVYYIRFSVENAVDVESQKFCIAEVDIGNTLYGGYDGNAAIAGTNEKTYFGKNVYFPYVGYRIENGVLVGAADTYTIEEITHVDVYDSAATIEVTAPVEAFDTERLRNVVLKYGRYGDTDYVMARIFKNTITGESIIPKLLAFTPGGKTMTALAKENDFVMAINAGCFDTTDNSCIGTTIVDGVVITDHLEHETIGSCDVFTIDSSGNLASYTNETTTADLLSAGVVHAVQAKCTLIENYAKYDMETADTLLGNDGLVNAKHPRTAIGQYKNGDYMVFTCGGRETNQAGMTCAEMQDIFVADGVKYAYCLDGGGSCNMMFFKKELAPHTEGRPDPSYIVFN